MADFQDYRNMEIKEIFDLFDLTGEGKITFSQCGNLMRVLGLTVTNAKVLELLGNPKEEEMEERTLSLAEFMCLFKTVAQVNTPACCEESLAIHVFDKDRNGQELCNVLPAGAEEMTEQEIDAFLAGVEDAKSWAEYEEFLAMVKN